MMTIEEKAKTYDEALERAKQIRNGNPSSRTAIVVCEQIFPELRESEDERIRKALVNFLQSPFIKENLTDEKVAPWLAYLERQKEHVPEAFTPNMTVHPGPNIPSCPDPVIAKMKEHVPENEESGTRKEQKPYCPSNDELEKAAEEFRKKNVPPIEPISDELIDIIKGEFEGFRRLLKKKGIDYEPQRGYWEGFARLFDSSAREYVKEQKSAWSEEDESILNNIIAYKYLNIDDLEWIKKLPKRFSLQPKQEWSEDDEKTYNLLLNHFQQTFEHRTTSLTREEIEKIYDFLKDLHLKKGQIICVDADRIQEYLPRITWKPSEEQMKALESAIDYLVIHTSTPGNVLLQSLCEDLKKL